MSNDKLRDAMQRAVAEIRIGLAHTINLESAKANYKDAAEILEKALKPEPEFYPGQAIIVTYTMGEQYKGYYLGCNPQSFMCHIVAEHNTSGWIVNKCSKGAVKPDPDAPAPPGYLKIHTHDGSLFPPKYAIGKHVVIEHGKGIHMEKTAMNSHWDHVIRYAIWPESEGE